MFYSYADVAQQLKFMDDANPERRELLAAIRKKVANEHEIPAYVVFSDKSLKDMTAKVPRDAVAFRRVHGVGEVKAESYGPIFLRAIEEWGTSRS